MSNPQQPELRRSERGEVVQDSVKTRHGGPTDESGDPGPVPEANEPGHHPEEEQDKPTEVPTAYKMPDQ
ncbi:MAG TPA: hypothetical protein VK988_11295 [Acidimicrobiales bacterium]|nr:hypothetical protein [Acidimicrobiales bacterium]